LSKNHDGEVPMGFNELVFFEGIADKVAILTLFECYGIVAGIGTDRHLKKGFDCLGWSKGATSNEEARVHVEHWLDREHWPHMNDTLAGLGQLLEDPEYCKVILEEAKKFDTQVHAAISKLSRGAYSKKRKRKASSIFKILIILN
jgi:endonuclease III